MTDEIIPVPDLGTPEPTEMLPPIVEVDELAPERPRKRGRRFQQPAPPPEPVLPMSPNEQQAIAKAFGMMFRVVFQIVATKRGEHWAISEGDENMLGVTWGEACAPWLRDSAKYAPFAMAALATVGVVMPRVQQDAANVEALQRLPQPQAPELVK